METLTNPRTPSDPTAPAASRWVMLYRNINDSGSSSTSAVVADAKTTAASSTSSGQLFSVSFSIAPPPALSRLHCTLLAGGGRSTPSNVDDDDNNMDTKDRLGLEIIAAHDDSVLLECMLPRPGFYSRVMLDYFLYEAGGGAGRSPPTLSLLPGCYVSNMFEREKDARHVPTRRDEARNLSFHNSTGVLRRGSGGGDDDGEVLVAQLELSYDDSSVAELCVLRPGHDDDWVLKRVPIVRGRGEAGELQQRSIAEIDAAVPVGGRFMCWVDYLAAGFLLCDVAAAAVAEENSNPKLRYVPLPAVSLPKTWYRRSERPNLEYCQKLADAGAGALRFVSVAPRCCCGGPGQTTCERSSFAFNVTTWTLVLSMEEEEPMVWVKDGVLDCDELWQLPGYGGLPRVPLQHPVVSSDDPNIVCFTVCENHYFIDDADKTVWLVEINTKSKALLSVVRSDMEYYTSSNFLPAKLCC